MQVRSRKTPVGYRAVQLMLWLLLGTFVNMIVCWACARNFFIALDRSTGGSAAMARMSAAGKGLPPPPTPALVPMTEVKVAPHWPRAVPENWPQQPKWTTAWVETGWRAYDARSGRTDKGAFTLLHNEYGLPFRGICWWASMAWPPNFRPENGDKMKESSGLRVRTAFLERYDLGSLPLTPVWPGFALNTLFYAAIAWGLWQVPLAIRRRRRRRLNRCVKCGYDRTGIADDAKCPECGH